MSQPPGLVRLSLIVMFSVSSLTLPLGPLIQTEGGQSLVSLMQAVGVEPAGVCRTHCHAYTLTSSDLMMSSATEGDQHPEKKVTTHTHTLSPNNPLTVLARRRITSTWAQRQATSN